MKNLKTFLIAVITIISMVTANDIHAQLFKGGVTTVTPFKSLVAQPLDERNVVTSYNDLTNLKAYIGMLTYVINEEKYYFYSTNQTWDELTTGGSDVSNFIPLSGSNDISGDLKFYTYGKSIGWDNKLISFNQEDINFSFNRNGGTTFEDNVSMRLGNASLMTRNQSYWGVYLGDTYSLTNIIGLQLSPLDVNISDNLNGEIYLSPSKGISYKATNDAYRREILIDSVGISSYVSDNDTYHTKLKINVAPDKYSGVQLPVTNLLSDTTKHNRTLVVSVNGNYADVNGNVVVSGGGDTSAYLPLAGNTTETKITGDVYTNNKFVGSGTTIGLGTNLTVENGASILNIKQTGIQSTSTNLTFPTTTTARVLPISVNSKYADANGNIAIAWTDVTSKPTTFAPTAHTHVVADITDFPTNIARTNINQTFGASQTFSNPVTVPSATANTHAVNLYQVRDEIGKSFTSLDKTASFALTNSDSNKQLLINGTELSVEIPASLMTNFNVSMDFANAGSILIIPDSNVFGGDISETVPEIVVIGEITYHKYYIPTNGMIYIYKTPSGKIRIKGDII